MDNINLERKKVFNFKGKNYEIEFPTVGEFIDIEDEKVINSNGHYYELLQSKTITALRSVQIIECISFLKILCPSLFEDLKVNSYRDIDTIDFAELLTIYQKEIAPWYNKWFENFNKVLIDFSNLKNKDN